MRLPARAGPLFLLLLIAPGCAPAVDAMQPVPLALRGHVSVEEVTLSFAAPTRRQVALADARLAVRAAAPGGPTGRAALPFATMLVDTIETELRARNIAAGRAVAIVVEMDALQVPDLAASALGRSDRLAGQVFVRDRATDETLAAYYVTVDNSHAGLLGQLTRGTGIRERLAEAFACHLADELAASR